MNHFQLEIPTRVYFGRGVYEEALKKEKRILKGNIMIVTTGNALEKCGLMQKLVDTVKALDGVEGIIIFDRVSANPKLSEIREGIKIGKEKPVSAFIGFGGGSSMDAAKAIAACMGQGENLDEFFYNGREPEASLPVIAMPTTAGTGSELSKGAILSDDVRHIKSGIRGAKLYPDVAIVDPQFTDSVPLKVTVETGFDVLAHAMETYVSKKSNLFSRRLSEQAADIVGEYLPRLIKDLSDQNARDKMGYASMIMGINLGNVGTCLPHRLQYPLGAHTETSHGVGLASLYRAWISCEYEYSKEDIKRMVYLVSKQECNNKQEVLDVFDNFMSMIGLDVKISSLGMEERQIGIFAKEISGNIMNDPAAVDKDIIEKIYRMAYYG